MIDDTLSQVRSTVEQRLSEIAEEVASLERALVHLDGSGGRKRRKARAGGTKRKAGKRAARGQRAEEFLALVQKEPAANGSEIARKMGISPNQVYALASRLEKQGRVAKTESGYRLTP